MINKQDLEDIKFKLRIILNNLPRKQKENSLEGIVKLIKRIDQIMIENKKEN